MAPTSSTTILFMEVFFFRPLDGLGSLTISSAFSVAKERSRFVDAVLSVKEILLDKLRDKKNFINPFSGN